MSLNNKTIHDLYLNLHTKLHNKISVIESNIKKYCIRMKYFLKFLKYVTFFITSHFRTTTVNKMFYCFKNKSCLHLHTKLHHVFLLWSKVEKYFFRIKCFETNFLIYVSLLLTWQFQYISVNEGFKYLINIYIISKYAYETILKFLCYKAKFFRNFFLIECTTEIKYLSHSLSPWVNVMKA